MSHFDVGLSSECHTNTTSSDSFKSYPEQAVTAHVDRARWMKQMAGNDMVGCTQYNSKVGLGSFFNIPCILPCITKEREPA